MSKNVNKWQVKCSDLQRLLDEEVMLKEEIIDKVHHMDRKVCEIYTFFKYNDLS